MIQLEKLNSELFIWELWEANWWSLLEMSFTDALESENIFMAVKKYATGYCDGGSVRVRPNPNMYAVMFENKDGEKLWFHINKHMLEEMFEIK